MTRPLTSGKPAARTIECEAIVRRPPEVVFDFLAELDNHWLIAGRRLVSRRQPLPGGAVRVKFGPPGVRRWAISRIERAERPRLLEGTARTARSEGTTRWLLEPAGDGATRVRFVQELRPRPLDDRLLVALAAPWLRGQYRRALDRLSRTLEN